MTWLPFDLHPEYPREGIPRADLIARYGPRMTASMSERFAQAGLEYTPNSEVVPNSLNALRLTELARDLDRHEELHDRLMDAYWRDGVNIGDHDELRRLATDLPADEVERVLTTDDYADRVRDSTSQAVSIGVTGVPGWVIDGKLLVPGAQPREVFEQAFAQL